MPIQALRSTGNVVTDGRPKNWREGILRKYPNGAASLTPFLAFVDSEETSDPEFSWWEKSLPTRTVFINNGAGYNTAATTLTVSDSADADPGKIMRAGYVVQNLRTKEQMRVTTDQSAGTTLVVERAFGEVSAAAMNDNDELRVVGNVNEEGADLPTPTQYDPVKQFNYTQIFRTPLSITRTAKKTRLRTEDAYKQAKIEALELQSIDMEWAFIWGQRKEVASGPGGHPIRSTRGIVRRIEADAATNDLTISDGSMSETELIDQLGIINRYGSTEKIAFAGSTAMNVLTRIAKAGTTAFADQGTEVDYGLRVRRFTTASGDLLLRQHPLFNLYGDWQDVILIVDLGNIRYRYIDDLQFLRNRQSPGADRRTDEFLAECGLEVHHADTHGIIRNVTAYAA